MTAQPVRHTLYYTGKPARRGESRMPLMGRGAPIELLHRVFEKICAGESVAISFDITPARISRDRRIAPAEFPPGMLGAKAPALETHGEGACIECIERRDAIDDHQSMDVELQLHQKLVAKAIGEAGGIGSAAYIADLDPRASGIGQLHFSRFGVKARQLIFDRLRRFDHLAVRKSSVRCCASVIVNISPLRSHYRTRPMNSRSGQLCSRPDALPGQCE
jgi:hypothetical protein